MFQLYQKIISVILICVCLFNVLSAKHIVGGDFTFKEISRTNQDVTYELTLTIYRDCIWEPQKAELDEFAEIGIFQGKGNDWITVDVRNVKLGQVVDLPTDLQCGEINTPLCIESGLYVFQYTLPISDDDYIFGYQKCCRSDDILNLDDIREAGATYFVHITSEGRRIPNSGPSFQDVPPVVICALFPLISNQSVVDDDGDIIIYKMCEPLDGGGSAGLRGNPNTDTRSCDGISPDPRRCPPPFDKLFFSAGYSHTSPLAGDPVVTLNPANGVLSGTPNLIGDFVVGICIEEYRDGKLLSTTQRDYQYKVQDCTPDLVVGIESDEFLDDMTPVVISCGDLEFDIKNRSFGGNGNLSYQWYFYDGTEEKEFTTTDIRVTVPEPGEYYGRLVAINEESNCVDSIDFEVYVYPGINAGFSFLYDTCQVSSISVTSSASTEGDFLVNEYYFFEDSLINGRDVIYQPDSSKNIQVIQVVEDNNGCKDSLISEIPYFPIPDRLYIQPSRFKVCVPNEVKMSIPSSFITEEYDLLWDFGDGNSSEELTPTHLYTAAGIYDVSVAITSPEECVDSLLYTEFIEVLEGPIADFYFDPEGPVISNPEFQAIPETQKSKGHYWIVDNEEKFIVDVLEFTAKDTGLICVSLFAQHENLCVDSITKKLTFLPTSDWYMPNVFTPNGDGLNEIFKGKGRLNFISDFRYEIWNRWGEQIFFTTDPESGWDGTVEGQDAPVGAYVYKVYFTDAYGKNREYSGNFSLMR